MTNDGTEPRASAMIRARRGLVFVRELSLPEFYRHSRELKRALSAG